jgi:uncharacterized Zn finger protein
MISPIASILHRDTIAALVGAKTYERGEACFRAQRVLHVDFGQGQVRGTVRPQEAGRPMYAVRIWAKDDGMAYSCTCPVGKEQKFCKHGVALALAHMEGERDAADDRLETLRRALVTVPNNALADGLIAAAKDDMRLQNVLAEICMSVLAR